MVVVVFFSLARGHDLLTLHSEIFQPRHGEVGVAAASALVSGLGNLGSVTTVIALARPIYTHLKVHSANIILSIDLRSIHRLGFR